MTQNENMKFEINDHVIYGGNGVCLVEDICTLDSVADDARLYYRLKPLYEKDSVVYAPVDNIKSTLRELLSRDEIISLLQDLPNLETIQFKSERTVDSEYKCVLQSYAGCEILRVLKTAFTRIKIRKEKNKKTVVVDERYFQRAKNLLFGEMAVVFQTSKEQVCEIFAEQTEMHIA
jgi:Transcriptional regulators, similar to M. xanthus CarD